MIAAGALLVGIGIGIAAGCYLTLHETARREAERIARRARYAATTR